ncbi:MAG: DUF1553 domain-containing protein [Verrucomicrobiales bacterium]
MANWSIAGVVALAATVPSMASADFRYEIAPIFARYGCAAADCHGGATGRGGFKLSLFATEPRADYEAITRELGGRRIDFRTPTASLLLRKPTRSVKHGGGRVFDQSSSAYRELLSWIESGAHYESANDDALVLEELQITRTGDQVSVSARFADGTHRDVTHLAVFQSTAPDVAAIDEDGLITRNGPGKAWLLARFSGVSARTRINIPFPGEPFVPAKINHPLDQAWLSSLQEQNLRPSPAAPAHVLARRLYFDLAGRPPRPDELRDFALQPLATTADQLLTDDVFVNAFLPHVAPWFSQPGSDRSSARIAEALRENEPLSDLVGDLLLPGGLELKGDPRDQAEFVGAQLLGISIGCARCHNHPHDRWTQAEHLRFSALFRNHREGGRLVQDPFFVPGEGHRPVQPALLPLGNLAPAPDAAPDAVLTSFILDGGHDLFSRNIANRVFAVLLGNPLVDSPDDHRLSNPPAQEAMLDVLASQFKNSGHDLHALVRFIVTSQVYAMASDPPNDRTLSGDPALRYVARREARPLTRIQFERAVESVIGFTAVRATTNSDRQMMMQADPLVSDPTSPLADQLAILNSGLIQRGLATKGNEVEAIFTFSATAEQALCDLFILTLSRSPRAEESERLLPEAEKGLSDPGARDDLATALLLSREFGSIR